MTFDEVKAKFVGKTDEPSVMEVEKGAAKLYAVAVNDLNPLYLDEEAARVSKYGAIVAPPGFFGWPVKQPAPQLPKLMIDFMAALAEAGFPDILDGAVEYEFLLPVRAGDLLEWSCSIARMASRGGGSSKNVAFTTVDSTFTNQNGHVVCKLRQMIIALSRVAQ